MKRIIFSIGLLTAIISCEKDITVDLPKGEQKLVVEGTIENGKPPVVILTKTIGYFEPADVNTLEGLFVHNADVYVSDGNSKVKLQEFCTDNLPDSVKIALAQAAGVPVEQMFAINYCVYTTPSLIGQVGKTYTLEINAEGKFYSSITTIPPIVIPDSFYFKTQPGYDSLGYLWLHFTDPANQTNFYRIFTQRKNKDSRFIPLTGSVYDDRFINGKTIDFYFVRGQEFNSQKPDDQGEEAFYFKKGDTIYVKFCTIDNDSYDFWASYENEIYTAGNPFASPTTIKTNIKGGGLGVWCGYGVYIDTVYAR